MNTEDQYIFTQLKLEVAQAFLENNSAPTRIEEWKGEDIITFQEDLLLKVKGSVSEKWFYTYFKNDAEKLPRIDILNLLSKYVGYNNWMHFKDNFNAKRPNRKPLKKYKKQLWFLLLVPCVILVYAFINKETNYTFCFTDALKNEPITLTPLNITILKNNQTPTYKTTDRGGCFSFSTSENSIKFIVQSPYYKTDTIVKQLHKTKNHTIKLNVDNYTLMLNYYMTSNLKAWETHKAKLNEIIADDADIYEF